jgi:hypothetical protein
MNAVSRSLLLALGALVMLSCGGSAKRSALVEPIPTSRPTSSTTAARRTEASTTNSSTPPPTKPTAPTGPIEICGQVVEPTKRSLECGGGTTDADLENLGLLTKLDSLAVHWAPVTDAGIRGIPGLTELTWLSLHATKVTDAGMPYLANLTKLETLSVVGAGITDEGAAHLAKLTELRRLDLHGSKITDGGLRSLASLTKLESLNLGISDVTDVGLAELAGMRDLERLNLRYTKVTDAGIDHLAGLPRLTSINFDHGELPELLPRGRDLSEARQDDGHRSGEVACPVEPKRSSMSIRSCRRRQQPPLRRRPPWVSGGVLARRGAPRGRSQERAIAGERRRTRSARRSAGSLSGARWGPPELGGLAHARACARLASDSAVLPIARLRATPDYAPRRLAWVGRRESAARSRSAGQGLGLEHDVGLGPRFVEARENRRVHRARRNTGFGAESLEALRHERVVAGIAQRSR